MFLAALTSRSWTVPHAAHVHILTDCGFATFVTHVVVEPEITWAKLATLAEGARLASERHWKRLSGARAGYRGVPFHDGSA